MCVCKIVITSIIASFNKGSSQSVTNGLIASPVFESATHASTCKLVLAKDAKMAPILHKWWCSSCRRTS